jgi:hypothetical protein
MRPLLKLTATAALMLGAVLAPSPASPTPPSVALTGTGITAAGSIADCAELFLNLPVLSPEIDEELIKEANKRTEQILKKCGIAFPA